MADPLISVIIPVYNAEQFLRETLDSVGAQTYTNIEVIAVDDGSMDKSAEIIKRYPAVRYIRQENGGVSKARNTGIKSSSGDYIAFLTKMIYGCRANCKFRLKSLLAIRTVA